jgi:hypothetical protein
MPNYDLVVRAQSGQDVREEFFSRDLVERRRLLMREAVHSG